MSVTFRAMNTDVLVVAPTLDSRGEHRLAGRIAAVFEASERRFSRFRADSELSRLNRDGRLRSASTQLIRALLRARRFSKLTGGLFTPAVGAALVAAGYDRSFEADRFDRDQSASALPCAGLEAIAVDPLRRAVDLPPGLQLDFGGFIKGWTVDRAAALMPRVAALDAGGDAALRGVGPNVAGWLVDVENPGDASRVLVTLCVSNRAVATSAPNRRRWLAGGRQQHHLIDPTTGRPSESDLAQVTIVAPTAEEADVLAKPAFLRGARDGRRFLERLPGIGAVLVHRNGDLDLVGAVELTNAA